MARVSKMQPAKIVVQIRLIYVHAVCISQKIYALGPAVSFPIHWPFRNIPLHNYEMIKVN